MTCGLLALATSPLLVVETPDLRALGCDHIQQIAVAKPRTTFENLNDLNGSKWVYEGYDGAEVGTACGGLTNDGLDLITGWNTFQDLRGAGTHTDGEMYFIVTKRDPFAWVSGTTSQQKHMDAFWSVQNGADGVRHHDHFLAVFDHKNRARWIAGTVYPLMKPNPNPKDIKNEDRYIDAGGTDRLLMALVRADERGEHPNTEVTVPLGAKLKVLRMGARFDNLGRAVVDLFVKTGTKTCEHRWYLVDFGTKRGSEQKARRRILPLSKYTRPGQSQAEYIIGLTYERTLDRYLFRPEDAGMLQELDASGRVVTSFSDKQDVGDRFKYWRGHLLLEPVKQEKVDDGMGGRRFQYRSQGLYLFSEDRKSKTFLGPYTWMCSSVNEKHLLLRRLTDETVWKLSWDKSPGN